jgi:periplasmic copper chaperone A
MHPNRVRARALAATAVAAVGLTVASNAWAHAELSPPVAKSKTLQLFTLAVPTEKEGATTTKIELTPPSGFGIDSFAPATGWKRQLQQTGSSENAVIQKVTWSGGSVPTGEDSVFQFLASPDSSKTYTFAVRQTYSDGSVVDWNGPESSDTPAPRIDAMSSLGGGGSSTLAIIAIVVGGIGILLAGVALAARGGSRPVA